jgi:hypothetical protein
MKKFILILLISIISASAAEDTYVIVQGACSLNTSYRDQNGRQVDRENYHSYISYPVKFDTEKYTEQMARTAYQKQIKSKHNNYRLLPVSVKKFTSKIEAKAFYNKLRKDKAGIKLSLSTRELEKLRKDLDRN